MSAPATHTSGLPLRTTAARIPWSRSSRSSTVANSSRTARANVLTEALGTSSVMMAIPSRTTVERVVVMNGPGSLSLHDHREPHSAGRANRHQPELAATPPQLVQQSRRDTRACRAERVPDGDRATHDVQAGAIEDRKSVV